MDVMKNSKNGYFSVTLTLGPSILLIRLDTSKGGRATGGDSVVKSTCAMMGSARTRAPIYKFITIIMLISMIRIMLDISANQERFPSFGNSDK